MLIHFLSDYTLFWNPSKQNSNFISEIHVFQKIKDILKLWLEFLMNSILKYDRFDARHHQYLKPKTNIVISNKKNHARNTWRKNSK